VVGKAICKTPGRRCLATPPARFDRQEIQLIAGNTSYLPEKPNSCQNNQETAGKPK
jgi:hypothetical protein